MTTSDSDVLRVERDGPVTVLTLDRPAKRNAFDGALLQALASAFQQVADDDAVRAVVLTGTDPAFCAGVDLGALAGGDKDLVLPTRRRGPIPEMPKPVIGAINGPAVTGGLELALACDWLVASDRARFADTHARVGVMPGWGMSVRLPEAVGSHRARQMTLTGNYVDADTALSWGLVNEVVPHDELLGRAVSLARDVADCDPVAIGGLLGLYRATGDVAPGDAWRLEADNARAWWRDQLDPAAVERRRRGVIERGRTQL